MTQDPSRLTIPLGAPFFTAPDGTVVQDSGGTPIDLTGQKITVAPVRQGDEASIVFALPDLNRLGVIGLVNITPDDIGKTFIIRNASSQSPFLNPDPPPTVLFGETNNGIYVIIARGTGFATETEAVVVERIAPIPTVASDVLTGTANFADTETVTIGTKTYTFQTVLTDVDGNVLIGADLAASLQNLFDAIDLTGTAGVQYALSMTPNVAVEPAANTATTLTVEARILGISGNEIPVSTTAANASWATPKLTGGTGIALFAPDPNNGNIEWAIVDPADFLEGDPLKALAERAAELRINNPTSGPARFADFNPIQPPLVTNNSGGVFSKVQRS